MERQQILRLLLTPIIHSIFGGQTIWLSKYFPQIKRLSLLLTFILNIYYAYMTSISERFEPHTHSYLRYYTDWNNYDL